MFYRAFKLLFFLLGGILYDIFIISALPFVLILSLFNKKVLGYLKERSSLLKLMKELPEGRSYIWFLVSSTGEFEQTLPVADRFIEQGLNPVFLFHSNRGYEHAQTLIDKRYLSFLTPLDFFIGWVILFRKKKPAFILINRHEFWPGFYLSSYLLSRIFLINVVYHRSQSPLTKLYYGIHISLSKITFNLFDYKIDNKKILFSADTRYERVSARLKENAEAIEKQKTIIRSSLIKNQKLVLIGNCHIGDWEILCRLLEEKKDLSANLKFVIVPNNFKKLNPSILNKNYPIVETSQEINFVDSQVIVLNIFGGLFELFGGADVVWIGGGFNKSGVHNCIEPSIFNLPIICGTNTGFQPEISELIAAGQLSVVSNIEELFFSLNNFNSFQKLNSEKVNSSDKIATEILKSVL